MFESPMTSEERRCLILELIGFIERYDELILATAFEPCARMAHQVATEQALVNTMLRQIVQCDDETAIILFNAAYRMFGSSCRDWFEYLSTLEPMDNIDTPINYQDIKYGRQSTFEQWIQGDSNE